MNGEAMFNFLRKYNAPLSCVNAVNRMHAIMTVEYLGQDGLHELQLKTAIKIAYELGKRDGKNEANKVKRGLK